MRRSTLTYALLAVLVAGQAHAVGPQDANHYSVAVPIQLGGLSSALTGPLVQSLAFASASQEFAPAGAKPTLGFNLGAGFGMSLNSIDKAVALAAGANANTGGVQAADGVRPDALEANILPELFEIGQELLVGLLVCGVGRAAVLFHAALLIPEVLSGIGFQKFNQIDQECAGLPAGIGLGEQAPQMVDVLNQHLVLLVNRFRTGFELFVPNNHGAPGSISTISPKSPT